MHRHGLFSLLRTLSARRRLEFLLLALASAVSALIETAKIGAVVPVLALAMAPESVGHGLLSRVVEASGGHHAFLVASTLLIAAALIGVATRLILVWLTHRFVVGVGQDIADQIFARMLRQPYEAYKTRHSSALHTGLDKVGTVIFYVVLPAMQALTGAVVGIAIMAVMVVIDPVTASIAGGTIGGIFLAVRFSTRRRLDANSRTISSMVSVRMALVQEALGNIRDILLDHSQPLFEAHFREVDAKLRKAQSVNMLITAGPRAFVESAGIIALVAIAALVADRPGGLTAALPTLGALALGAQRLLPLLQQVYAGWANVAGNLHSVDDVLALMNLPMHVDCLPSGEPPAGDIVLKNVSFAFADGDPVLQAIDLRIPGGTSVGIVGESGSGKTTLTDILMGLLTPTSGVITIGGRPLDSQLRPLWQAQIAHVPQSVYLSDASIASNIAFGVAPEEVNFERVVAAAQAAQAAGFIERLPGGYETRVGEGGARLSGGERQRIGMARALYKDAAVLVLDEATSALDEETEAAVFAALEERRTTLIMVTHRRSPLRNCDVIFEMVRGRTRTVQLSGASGLNDLRESATTRA